MEDTTGLSEDKQLLDGRYRIDGKLGSGGMSVVYHGHDERFDRPVAIKMLKPQSPPATADSFEAAEILEDEERSRRRFLREIRTTARLEHPGIPAVYDTGVLINPDGSRQLWVVMQLLRGVTVRRWVDDADYVDAPPTVAWAAAVAAQLAAVLADVHRVDIVHRDVKPENVVIADDGLVKLLDFGIAILRGAGALPRLTQIDHTVGTPPYMSPEQSLGQVVTAASDVYSLGCLLYELLTGDPPFLATRATSLRTHHLSTPPPSVRAARPGVPVDIDRLVVSMMAKPPGDRPTAETVYTVLAPLAATPDPTAAEDESRDPTRPFRRPLLAPAARRAADPRTGPELTEGEVIRIEGEVAVLLRDQLPTDAIRIIEDNLPRAHSEYLQVRMRELLAHALFDAGVFTRAAPLLENLVRTYLAYLQPHESIVIDSAYRAGVAYAELGKPDRALRALSFYVRNADPAANRDQLISARFLIAHMKAVAGDFEDARDDLRALRPVLCEVFGPDSAAVRNLDRQLGKLNSTVEDGNSR
ncbi:serine/threonine-protein kinase [Nocardia sp. NPDC004604]|uniref:serine/threonine-protein kinase n=1 Tax=Nocardia sp. NPDC004604 TaxID=3157013 RepID=UPI0033B43D62